MPDNMVPPTTSIRIRTDWIRKDCTSGLSAADGCSEDVKILLKHIFHCITIQLDGIEEDLSRMNN